MLFCVIATAGCVGELGDGEGEDILEQTGALAGYTRIIQETPLSSSLTKDLTVYCPPNTVAYGAGYAALSSTNGSYYAVLHAFTPSADGASWFTRAEGVVRNGTTWKLQITLGCGPKLDGYKVVTTETALSTAAKQSVAPTCSTQKAPPIVTLGGGFMPLDAANQLVDADLVQYHTNTGWWDITAKSGAPAGTSWKLRGSTICVKTSAVPGYHLSLREVPYTTETTSVQTVTGYCDLGQKPLAAGIRLLSTSDTDQDVWLRASVPVTGGWKSSGLRVPPTQKQLAPRALQQQIICVN